MDERPEADPAAPPQTPLQVGVWAADPLVQAGLVALLDGADGVAAVLEEGAEIDVALWDADAAEADPAADEGVPVLALVADLDRSAALLAAGVAGVLSRRSAAARVVAGLRALAAGLAVVPAERLGDLFPGTAERVANLPLDPLTEREREVLALVAEGLTNRAIAARLEISDSTVKFHLNTLLGKFAADTRTELVVRAIQTGELHI